MKHHPRQAPPCPPHARRALTARIAKPLPAVCAVWLCLLSGAAAGLAAKPVRVDDVQINTRIRLDNTTDTARLLRTDQGLRYQITYRDGRVEWLSAEQFTDRLWNQQHRRSWAQIMLNISSPIGMIWVAVGLLGQVLFTGRMVVQWLVSEKKKRSVVPVAFWWMSLGGATMLIVYFAWRQDIVGILGQATGWLIYVRNLWFIYRHRPDGPALTADPGPEPELDPKSLPS